MLYDSGVAQDQDSRSSSPESVAGGEEGVRQTTEVRSCSLGVHLDCVDYQQVWRQHHLMVGERTLKRRLPSRSLPSIPRRGGRGRPRWWILIQTQLSSLDLLHMTQQATSSTADATKTFEAECQFGCEELWMRLTLMYFSGEADFFFKIKSTIPNGNFPCNMHSNKIMVGIELLQVTVNGVCYHS